MNTVTEPARSVPVRAEADVVVVGGGPSGIMAAIAAARSGARTLLAEHHGFLGGMATAALVGPISKFNIHGKRIVRGLPGEFVERMASRGGAIIDLPSGNIPFDAEIYKQVAQEMVIEAGVELWLHAHYSNVLVNPATHGVSHVIFETKSGREAVSCREVVDCSGSAEVVADSGLPWCFRSGEKGELQPMSLMFRLGGVDTGKIQQPLMDRDGTKYFNRRAREILELAVVEGRIRQFGGPWLVYGSTFRAGEVTVNATRISSNAVAPGEFSFAEICLRRDMVQIFKELQSEMPELQNACLLESAVQSGIRETRSIIGDYTLTGDDLLQGRIFPDTVALGGHPMDIHRAGSAAQDVQFVRQAYGVPWRSLVPQGAQNVLVAGGSLSATREAFASVRVQAQCMALGQAAGTAAARCAMESISVGDLDGVRLRNELRAAGALVDEV
jgi:hypothetical protein